MLYIRSRGRLIQLIQLGQERDELPLHGNVLQNSSKGCVIGHPCSAAPTPPTTIGSRYNYMALP